MTDAIRHDDALYWVIENHALRRLAEEGRRLSTDDVRPPARGRTWVPGDPV